MKIKIIQYYGEYHDEFDALIAQGITDWEEVDEATLRKLQGWCASQRFGAHGERYLILIQPDISIPQCVADYMEIMHKQDQAAAERKAKAEEKKRIKLAQKKKLAEEQEVKLLHELLKKHQDKI